MNQHSFLRHSYSSRLQAYWNTLSAKKQRVVVLIILTLYTLLYLFTAKTIFSSNNQEKQNSIQPVKYLLSKQKRTTQLTIKA